MEYIRVGHPGVFGDVDGKTWLFKATRTRVNVAAVPCRNRLARGRYACDADVWTVKPMGVKHDKTGCCYSKFLWPLRWMVAEPPRMELTGGWQG